MPFHQPEELRYFNFDSLSAGGVNHAIFTRRGGISPAPWASLNVGGLRGDSPERVRENRERSFRTVGRAPESMYDVYQVHSAEVVCAESPRPITAPHLQADAILTDRPEVTLFMRFADCVPILLYDPCRRVIGLVHAGWQGTVNRIASAAVGVMQARYGTRPSDILAAIGPSIAAHHYAVGFEVIQQVERTFQNDAAALLSAAASPTDLNRGDSAETYFDLWAANRLLLEGAGVQQVEIAGICTACQLDDWYSHRGEHGNTGRFGALINLH